MISQVMNESMKHVTRSCVLGRPASVACGGPKLCLVSYSLVNESHLTKLIHTVSLTYDSSFISFMLKL